MGIFGKYDHQIRVGTTDTRLKLLMNADNTPMYSVSEVIPEYQREIKWVQRNWIGGHGQFSIGDSTHYFEGQSIDTTQEGKLILAPLITTVLESDDSNLDSAPVCFTWFETTGELLCATAGKIYRYNVSSNGKWTAATTAVTGVLQLVEYNGIMYAARGATGAYMYSTDGDTWTATDLIDTVAYGFFVSPNPAGTDNVLWKFKSKNEITSTTNGRSVADGGVDWASPTYIGDTTDTITNIFLMNDQLMIGREDGLFNVDSDGGVHSLMDDLKINKSSNNFKYVTQWQTGLYFSLGTGLGEITGYNSFEPMGAVTGIDDIGKTGVTVGLSADKDWLYHAVDEGTNTIIYKGREMRRSGSLVWEWCPWVFVGTNACAAIQVVNHSSTVRRLWFGYGMATAYVTITDNPLADTTARFAPSGWCRMSYNYGTNPYWDKMIQSIITETNCGGTLSNGTGTATGSPITLVAGNNTITTTGTAGTFTLVIPQGTAGTVTSGTCTVTGSPVTLVPGSNTITTSGAAGNFTVALSTTTVTPKYRKNSDTVATALTAAITSTGVIKTNLTSEISCKRIQVELWLSTDSSSATPVVTYFELRGTERPETIRIHEATYEIGDTSSSRVESVRTALRNARTSTSLVRFADLRFRDNTTSGYTYVVVEPGYPQEVEVLHTKDTQPELGIKIRFREINFS